ESQVGEPRAHPTSPPVRPPEPGGPSGWLVASLGVLAAVLALAGGLAVLAARRAGRGARLQKPRLTPVPATPLEGAAAPTRQPHRLAAVVHVLPRPRGRLRRSFARLTRL